MALPVYFISHGAGPWSFMRGPLRDSHAALEQSLRTISQQLGKPPNAILVISAHWEMPDFTVATHPSPPMLYDYQGFPPETYRVNYPAPGAPELAHRVTQALRAAGLSTATDSRRGFDHGAFVPLSIIYPEATVPVVQLSLQSGFDPLAHWTAGHALAPLRDQDVLILASGLSYHNTHPRSAAHTSADSRAFDAWLGDTLLDSTPAERRRRLLHWSEAPAARAAHPREEHLLPLLIAAGAAQSEPVRRFHHETTFLGAATISSFLFGSHTSTSHHLGVVNSG